VGRAPAAVARAAAPEMGFAAPVKLPTASTAPVFRKSRRFISRPFSFDQYEHKIFIFGKSVKYNNNSAFPLSGRSGKLIKNHHEGSRHFAS
jgi:hypothetical protein